MTKLLSIAMIFFFGLSLLQGCANADQSKAVTVKDSVPVFDLATARKEIDEANRNFMDLLLKGDSVGLANAYTIDAKFMVPNMPAVEGRKNIQSVAGGFINSGAAKLELKTNEIWGNESMISEDGNMTLSTKDGKQIDKGKYIVLWKKEDGKWKLYRDIFNTDLPMPMPAHKK